MSSSIWTPAALSSNARLLRGQCWRLVEAQHHVSTLKLVDALDEHALLERMIEETKPSVPPECRHLDYLLFTPFRYAAYPRGSRFRRPGLTEGVFYASSTPVTAVAEIAFHRLLFFANSPATPWPGNPAEYTAFAAAYGTRRALDLTRPPFDTDSEANKLRHVTDYRHCQALADAARAVGGRSYPLCLGARSRTRHQHRPAHVPCLYQTETAEPADMAASPARGRRSRHLRTAANPCRIRPQCFCRRSAHRGAAMGACLTDPSRCSKGGWAGPCPRRSLRWRRGAKRYIPRHSKTDSLIPSIRSEAAHPAEP